MVLVRILELLAGLILLMAMYWAPTLVAFGRRAQHWMIIVLLNSLLGWTIIGWLATLTWSILAKPEGQEDPAPSAVNARTQPIAVQTVDPAVETVRPLIAH